MKSEQTSKRGYQSRYAGIDTFVTAAQFITELVCENKAAKERKSLPLKFWQLPEWKKFFASQIHSANSLLKLYDERAVIKALKSYKGKWICSLRDTRLDPLIEAEQRLLATELKETVITTVESSQPSKPFAGNKNTFKKLKDL